MCDKLVQWIRSEKELRCKPNGTDLLKEDASSPGGYRAPQAGEIMKNPLLAKTLETLVEKGKSGFYEGSVAEAIINISQQLGGYLSLDDLKEHTSEVVDPVRLELSLHPDDPSINLWEHPPNGQGIIAQIALGIMTELEREGQIPKFSGKNHNSASYVMVKSEKSLHAKTETCQISTCTHTGSAHCFRRRQLVCDRSDFDHRSQFAPVTTLSRSESEAVQPVSFDPSRETRCPC